MKHLAIILLSLLPYAAHAQTKVEFVTPSIVRVQRSSDGQFNGNATGICVYCPEKVDIAISEDGNKQRYETAELIVEVDKGYSTVRFIDPNTGRIIMQENPSKPFWSEPVVRERIIYDDASAHTEETANGQVTVKDILRRDTIGIATRWMLNFSSPGEKALYGLGCQMEDYLNLKGKTLWLTQHNLKMHIPVLCSTNGYGLLFDAGCAMKFDSTDDNTSMQFEAAKDLDYYFVKGADLAQIVGGYRYLTGQVSLPPRYLFGYTQSKERYVSSDDVVQTLREYRRRHVPIDMIVQDWNYWPQGWGYMKMNPTYYPSPKALADSVHALNAKLMISIWPNPQGCPEEQDFRNHGFMLEHSVYDVFNPEARNLYWKYANDEFFSNGFDAWWCDSSEPLDNDWNRMPEPENGIPYDWNQHERRWRLSRDILSDALGPERSSLYSLYHAMGIYENQRKTPQQTEKRVVNLTRSSYAGQQRYGTVVWNGDTHASWASFKQQIPAGLNYMATGNPYWTMDVGTFFTGSDGRWFRKGEFPDGVNDEGYREFYTRMFQWGTFLPVLRSHGSDTPREIWQFGEPGTPYYDTILDMINLRYSLVPYIYSMAAMQTFGNYTMARPLAFDFADDDNVLDIKDQYMFGDFLVCPVTDRGATSRNVYLPEGTQWYDYWTGERLDGGKCIQASTPIDRLPLYLKAGSILVTTAPQEYTAAQVGKPLTVTIYPGKDATFTLYDDEGDNYNYETGKCARINLLWNDSKQSLTISDREGSFDGIPSTMQFTVTNGAKTKTIKYNGKQKTVKM